MMSSYYRITQAAEGGLLELWKMRLLRNATNCLYTPGTEPSIERPLTIQHIPGIMGVYVIGTTQNVVH